MSFFNENDPFDELVREFFGAGQGRRKNKIPTANEEDRTIDFIEIKDKIYAIFELPGYKEEEIKISIKNKNLEISSRKKPSENINNYLTQKFQAGIVIKKEIPNFIDTKKFTHTTKNGVLEITFNKK